MADADVAIVRCGHCQCKFRAKRKSVDRRVACPKCQGAVVVAAEESTSVPATRDPEEPVRSSADTETTPPSNNRRLSTGLIGFGMVAVSFVTLWNTQSTRGVSPLRKLDIAVGDWLGVTAVFTSSSMAVGYFIAVLGVIGAVGAIVCLVGAIRRSGILFGLLGLALYLIKFAIVWFH